MSLDANFNRREPTFERRPMYYYTRKRSKITGQNEIQAKNSTHAFSDMEFLRDMYYKCIMAKLRARSLQTEEKAINYILGTQYRRQFIKLLPSDDEKIAEKKQGIKRQRLEESETEGFEEL